MSKILIAYYSRKGQNYVNGSIKKLAKGNTEVVAEFVQKAVGGDLFEIDTVKKYAEDYTQCTVEAINRHGGDATLVHLPDVGIKGNSHFLMQEKNNREILELALKWLHEKGLDK